MTSIDDEEDRLRTVALQNAQSILRARQRAEDELVRTKDALRHSQERLTAALAAAGTGTFRWTIGSDALEWDDNLTRLLGIERPDTIVALRDLLAAVHPDDRNAVGARYDRSARDGSAVDVEFRVAHATGAVRWINCKAKVVRSDRGMPLYMTGACTDISARKDAEAALREETRMLELLNETGGALASTLDLQELIQTVTDAATTLSGAAFGAFFYNTVGPDGEAYQLFALSGVPRERFDGFGMPRATALFGPTFRGEGVIRCDDVLEDPRYGTAAPHHGMPTGHPPVRSYLAVPVRSRSGEVIGGLFFGHAETAVFTERAERLVVGVAAQAGVAIDNARLYDAAQKAATERKALLESERAARSAAERLSEIKDEFLATLSHELRTPLNAILGWAQILRSGGGEVDLEKGLETIERNARAQTQLIEDLLDMSRITSGKLRLDIHALHPVSIVEAAIETVKTAADAKGVRLERILDPAAGPVAADPNRLQQVVWNLLSNAIKFTPRGGKVQVLLERVNSHVEISVADTGCGIEPEFLPYVFDRFRQADAATTRQHGGLGLGLSIVKSLVELHGGSVHASSAGPRQGTTVTVHLPLTAVHRTETDARLHPGVPSPGPVNFIRADLTGLTILVVDDQPDARDLIRLVLEMCGAHVLTTGRLDEAVTLVQKRRPDVLISDIGMPDGDGYELLRRVRALGPRRGGRIPAIALTAFARSEDRTRALRAGFLVHVAKPVDSSELVATVASVSGRLDEQP